MGYQGVDVLAMFVPIVATVLHMEGDLGVLISDQSELVAWAGYTGPDAIDDWLRDACEFADDFDDDGDAHTFRRVIFHHAQTASSQYTIQLAYPFLAEALIEEADRAELHFCGAMNADGMAVEGATIGRPESDEDLTREFAADVLGGVEVFDVVGVLAGEWQFMEMSVRQGSNGEMICAWYVPADHRMVALGIGSDELFVVPLLENDEGVWVAEWPDPTISLWWTGPWAQGVPDSDPATTLESLRAELARYTGGSGRQTADR